jgi:hypothetical protein
MSHYFNLNATRDIDMFNFFGKKEKKEDFDLKKEVERLSSEVERLSNEVEDLKKRPDVILYYDGSLYVGSVNQDEHGFSRPHGFGTICHVNGVRYIGEWKDGLYDGQGTFYQDYYSYPFHCEWVKHMAHGKATWDGIHFEEFEYGIKKQ